jgi:hypothetical protein
MHLPIEFIARKWRQCGNRGIVVVEKAQALARVERLDARAGPLAEGAAAVHKYVELLLRKQGCSPLHYTLREKSPQAAQIAA